MAKRNAGKAVAEEYLDDVDGDALFCEQMVHAKETAQQMFQSEDPSVVMKVYGRMIMDVPPEEAAKDLLSIQAMAKELFGDEQSKKPYLVFEMFDLRHDDDDEDE